MDSSLDDSLPGLVSGYGLALSQLPTRRRGQLKMNKEQLVGRPRSSSLLHGAATRLDQQPFPDASVTLLLHGAAARRDLQMFPELQQSFLFDMRRICGRRSRAAAVVFV